MDIHDVSQRLRLTRAALGISEAEAAAAIGVSLTTYRRYEHRFPMSRSADHLYGLTAKFGVPWPWIPCGGTIDGETANDAAALRALCGHSTH